MLMPILLLVVLVVVVAGANSSRKKGRLSESAYTRLVSGAAIAVTIAALAVLVLRLKR